MHVIVTHDNADFDAIASLLGAAILYPGARAVLPHRINRNVRDFLHLYWDELPFCWPQDVPKARIARLTLVDSQHLPSVKGVDAATQLQVIDHHAPAPDLPAGVTVTLQELGAATTLMVEQLRSQHIPLTGNQATLMLLGIYEDTGSLTYANTTARDLYAAAWLLEQGASLDVARQFLNYPLTEEQQALYRQLADAMETHYIEGHTVMLAGARAAGYVEEISTLAHKLRDLFDPDALFVMIAMEDHIQLVARSTTNAIDVGAITARLGGGGHARAAAALIRHTDLPRLRDQVLELLRQLVRPSATVAQIMSYGVHTLAPTDSVARAAEMMARYGHEGFPVVDHDRIVGILTRREIDKALHHKLGGTPIHRVMRKGEFYVSPQDSVETLQALMTREGLGQVPVVENGKIIGIVTRTDLIKLWGETPRPSRADEIARLLSAALPPALLELLRAAGRMAAEQGDALFIVGGFVRDLLHQPRPGATASTQDIDLVVEGDAIRLARRLAERYGGQVRSHQRFGTAKWLIGNGRKPASANEKKADASSGPADQALTGLPPSLDFVTARTEFYAHPSALPQVERSSIKQDLHRRDFTINTLAIDLTPQHFGELLDFYGGESDLRQGLIRVLHSLSFVEDPTRMLRAARLEQRLGFRIEARTAELLVGALDLLDRVSGERIYHELRLIFEEAEPERALRRLDELGVLRQLHPALQVDDWVVQRMLMLRNALHDTPWAGTRPGEIHYLGLLMAHLSEADQQALATRLRLRAAHVAVLEQVRSLLSTCLPQLSQPQRPSRIYQLLADYSSDSLLIAWLVSEDETGRAQLAQFQRELRGVAPIINGHYLRRHLRLPPGPLYRQVLDELRAARLDGQVVTLEDEQAWLQAWLAEHGQIAAP